LGERAAEISGLHIMEAIRDPANEFGKVRSINESKVTPAPRRINARDPAARDPPRRRISPSDPR